MAMWQWTIPGQSGDWIDSDWTGDGTQNAGQTFPEGSSDDADIGNGTASASAYTVTISSADNVTVESTTIDDGSATLDVQSGGTLSVTNTLLAELGTLELDSNGSLSAAYIEISGSSVFDASAGGMLSFATIYVNGGSFTDALDLANTGTITIQINGSDFGSLTNESSGTLTNTSSGQINIDGGGLLSNVGSLVNNGTLSNNDNGDLTNVSGAVFVNNGVIFNNGAYSGDEIFGGELYNIGTFFNSSTGTVDNSGIINEQYGALANDGTLDNSGLVIVLSTGAVSGSGTYTQDGGTTTVSGEVSQGGVSIEGGIFDITGGTIESTVSIAAGAVLTGFGTISGPVENSGTVLATGGDLDIQNGLDGSATIAASSTLELGGGSSATINFTAPNSVLQLDYYPSAHVQPFASMGFQSGDVIQFFLFSLGHHRSNVSGQSPSFPGLSELTITAAGGLSETYGLGSLFPGEGISFSYNGGIPTVTLTGPSQDVWVGGSSSWTNGSNWSEGSPPTSTTDAFIDPTTPVTASINAGVTATAYTVSLGAGNSIKLKGGTIESTVSIAAGAMLTGFGTISGPVENSGTVLATGGDLNIRNGFGWISHNCRVLDLGVGWRLKRNHQLHGSQQCPAA